jgi:two-component system, OmpR family, sensor kinase
MSARTRILGWSVLLLTVSMLFTTVATHLLLIRRTDSSINEDLSHEVDEFRALSVAGAASPVRARLRTATERVLPSSDVIKFGLVDGHLASMSVNSGTTTRGPDAAVVERLSQRKLPSRGTIRLQAGEARYVAVPVRDPRDSARGTFVAAIPVAPEHSAVWAATWLQLEVGLASLLLAYLLAWVAAGRVLRPIQQTTALARRITDTDLNHRLPVDGHDELNQLTASFNAMLDRLQDTLAGQRRFLADAGHELRTPITIIQGNLDTLSAADADDRETLAIVADELARMARLVDELLLLGSAERPDFLRPAPTDLAVLAASLAAKAETLGNRVWSLHSTLSGWALLDPHRVTQAMMQLAENAVAHSEEGSDVGLVLHVDARDLVLSVVDHGAGVPPSERERIFDRFARVDRHHDDSTGLGLSIVAAIAAAHHGTITVSDTEGGGATFTLRVPWRPVPQPEAAPEPLTAGWRR